MSDAKKSDYAKAYPTDRVTARVPLNVKNTIEEAACISGSTLNHFMVQAALKEAKQVIEAERVVNLSYRDADTVFSLIENPPAPNEKLKQAVAKHKKFFGES